MTKPAVRVALASLCLLGVSSSAQAAANPLLGRWQAESDSCLAVPELDFLPTSQIMHTAATKFNPPGKLITHVRYFVAGPKVYVSSRASFAGAPMYTMIGGGELRDNIDCKYKRM